MGILVKVANTPDLGPGRINSQGNNSKGEIDYPYFEEFERVTGKMELIIHGYIENFVDQTYFKFLIKRCPEQ